jgi:hypothetical protein
MSEVAKARDWLGELQTLVAADQLEAFQALAKEAVEARPDLEDKVFAMAAEYAAEKAGDFFYPAVLPGDVKEATVQPKPAPFKRRDLTVFLAKEAAKEQRLLSAMVAKPKVEPEPEPEVEPEPEPEPQPKAKPTLRLIVAAAAKPAKLPPGVIGEIAEFSVASAMYPIMKFSIALGIGVVGTLIGRRIAGPTGPRGCATHLYQALTGPTGIGKEQIRTVGKLLMSTAGAGASIGPGRFKSGPALAKHVENKPVSLCFMDELGAYFAKISDPRATGWEKEISEVLRELWGLGWGRYDSPMGAHDESKVIINPALSLIGLTTPKELYRACKSREVSNGYLNRWNFIEEQDQPDWQRTDEMSLDVPAGLAKALRKLYRPVPV